ncbi:MAG: hypothetical protein ACRD1E_00990, partial [Terriglobales bacterium]
MDAAPVPPRVQPVIASNTKGYEFSRPRSSGKIVSARDGESTSPADAAHRGPACSPARFARLAHVAAVVVLLAAPA